MSSELGQFLRARREAAPPVEVSRPVSRRRTPGLRREEVATRAGVSADYYARLEQGREVHPSAQVLDALVAALGLTPPEAAYLHDLAAPKNPWRQDVLSGDEPDEYLDLLMTAWAHGPAYIVNHRCDVLGFNSAARPFLGGDSQNILRMLFTDVSAQISWVDQGSFARFLVSGVRRMMGTNIEDPHFVKLIDELCSGSEEFRRLWTSREVAVPDTKEKRFIHPQLGELIFDYELISSMGAPRQFLVVHRKNTTLEYDETTN